MGYPGRENERAFPEALCELLGIPFADRAHFQHQSAVLLDLTKTAEEQG